MLKNPFPPLRSSRNLFMNSLTYSLSNRRFLFFYIQFFSTFYFHLPRCISSLIFLPFSSFVIKKQQKLFEEKINTQFQDLICYSHVKTSMISQDEGKNLRLYEKFFILFYVKGVLKMKQNNAFPVQPQLFGDK